MLSIDIASKLDLILLTFKVDLHKDVELPPENDAYHYLHTSTIVVKQDYRQAVVYLGHLPMAVQ